MAQTAFRNYLDKKRERLQTKEEFFNELLQETRENYRKSKQSSVSSLRDLASVRLGLKLKRKANNLEKEFHKFRVEHRAETALIYKLAFGLISSRVFSGFITLCILGNTVVLALDRYPIDSQQAQLQNYFNMAFSVVFILEMPIKLLGLGFRGYFQDAYNAFDCLIAVTSLVDILVSSLSRYESVGVITSLRTFRLLRIFKLAKSWRQLHGLLKTMGKTLKDVSTFSVLLFLFVFTYTLLGMELFAYQARFNASGNLDMTDGEPPDANFDTFLDAFTTVFIVLTNDIWSKIYFDFYRASDLGVSATFFFITLIIIG